ncbi:amidohydrolase family protein [Haloferax sp. DFSO52]|uniref:amidohydrolase family protein n=1 Tax=Haloferax sp. DFSO52 TaxID=3388505 RepID=UPI003A83AA7E
MTIPTFDGGVDAHIHVGRREHFSDRLYSLIERFNPDIAAVVERDGEIPPAVVESALDEANLEYAVLLAHETPCVDIEIPNEYVLDYAEGNDRFIPFVSVNPNGHFQPTTYLERLVERGARGLKLYPSYQYFYPNDSAVYPLYATAQRLEIPVMFHTGTSVFEGSRTDFSRPMWMDDVACHFPDLTLIMAHGGRPAWCDEAVTLTQLHDNLYMDISGIPPHSLVDQYFPKLAKIAHKVLFGTDYPSTPAISQNIAGIAEQGISDEALQQMVVETPHRVLGI